MAYSGIEHCLLTQTIRDLFSKVLGRGPDSVALPRLFPFLRGSLFERILFSLSWQQKSSLTLLSTANVGRAALATITPVLAAGPSLAAAGVAALPSPPRKMRKKLHQEQIAWQNERKRRAVQGQAHARRIAICGPNWTGYPGQKIKEKLFKHPGFSEPACDGQHGYRVPSVNSGFIDI